MRRAGMSKYGSRKSFTRNAVRHHRRNFSGAPMRGGIRL